MKKNLCIGSQNSEQGLVTPIYCSHYVNLVLQVCSTKAMQKSHIATTLHRSRFSVNRRMNWFTLVNRLYQSSYKVIFIEK
ncbi:hypothetical protein XIS1_1070008 [Xenorhabdus innexi]|uniref:Uncharacterized protein n=1 Tax=Xenorhabdus innexi TaxID=290109 RepID=A0A1N6MQN5_9GAMM|nr:hypothetical protein XIS1_1070008 [Xenorhabdus innexi]